jgi:hypothetical protein
MKTHYLKLMTIIIAAITIAASPVFAGKGGGKCTDAAPPTVDAFAIPATSATLAVSITTFTASDDCRVTDYMVTESPTAPGTRDSGWSGSVPASYTFTAEGTYTLYAWALDGADNVSSSMSDSVTITIVTPTVDADTLDGLDSTDFAIVDHGHFYGGMTVVAKSGGEYLSPVDALNDIANWCGTPSASNPCLLKIMPGVYDIGLTTLYPPGYVDIEGSGENTTFINGSGITSIYIDTGNNEIRFITINNTETTAETYTYGIRASNSIASPLKLTNMTVNVSGGQRTAPVWGDQFSEVTLNNVTISAEGGTANNFGVLGFEKINLNNTNIKVLGANSYGVSFNGNSNSAEVSTIKNSEIFVTGQGAQGVRNYNGILEIFNSDISSSSNGILGGIISVANTKIDAINYHVYSADSTPKCFNNFDGNFAPIVCQ